MIGDIRAAVPHAEILVVDSSTDKTAEIATNLGARVIKQFRRADLRGRPCRQRHLRSAGGQVVVTLDCDDHLPHGPDPGAGPHGARGGLRHR